MTRHVAHDYAALVEVLRAEKAELGLSNTLIDDLCGFTPGHCDKLIGPTGSKLIGAKTLFDLAWVFGLRLELVPDMDKRNALAEHWERRSERDVRKPARISKDLVDRARPVIFTQIAKLGGVARAACLPGKHRSEIATNAAQVRWERHRRQRKEQLDASQAEAAASHSSANADRSRRARAGR